MVLLASVPDLCILFTFIVPSQVSYTVSFSLLSAMVIDTEQSISLTLHASENELRLCRTAVELEPRCLLCELGMYIVCTNHYHYLCYVSHYTGDAQCVRCGSGSTLPVVYSSNQQYSLIDFNLYLFFIVYGSFIMQVTFRSNNTPRLC